MYHYAKTVLYQYFRLSADMTQNRQLTWDRKTDDPKLILEAETSEYHYALTTSFKL